MAEWDSCMVLSAILVRGGGMVAALLVVFGAGVGCTKLVAWITRRKEE